jgi:hypothetical protein
LAILTYDLRVIGENDIARALGNVERRFVQHNARINRVLAGGGGRLRERASGSRPGAEIAEIAREQQRQQKYWDNAQKRSADQRVKQEIAGQKRVAKERQSFLRKAAAEARQMQMLEQRGEITAHRLKLANAERLKREELNKLRASARERIREQKASKGQFVRSIGSGVTGSVSKLGAVGAMGGAMIGVGGSVLAGSAVSETLRLDEQIRRFSVAGRDVGTTGMDPEAIRRQVMQIATARGVAPEAVMAGAQQFQTVTGRGDVGLKMADTFATFGQATGGEPAEIAEAAASLFQNFKVEDINDLTEALAKLTFQGKKGSFEFKDLAAQLPRVTAGLSGRGVGGGVEGIAKMGAVLQVVQRGTGDAAVTSTATDSIFRQMVAKADDIQKGTAFSTGKKMNVFEGGKATGAMRGDIDVLIADVLRASGGNKIELQKLFGDEGMKGMNPFISEFTRAGGGDAGHAAVVKMLGEFSGVGGNYKEIQRDASDIQQSASIQLELAIMELKGVFSEELTPVVKELTPILKELAPYVRAVTSMFLDLGKALADNPVLGIGAILAASLTAEIAKAQISSALTGGIITPLGAVGIAAVGVTAALAGFVTWLEAKQNEGKAAAKDAALRGDEVRKQAQAEIDQHGALTPETRAKLQTLALTEDKTLAAGSEALNEGTLTGYGRSVAALFGSDDADAEMKRRSAVIGAVTSKEYQGGATETKRLLGVDEMAQRYGRKNFAAQEIDPNAANAVGEKIGDAIVKKINASTVNRSDKPSGVKKS